MAETEALGIVRWPPSRLNNPWRLRLRRPGSRRHPSQPFIKSQNGVPLKRFPWGLPRSARIRTHRLQVVSAIAVSTMERAWLKTGFCTRNRDDGTGAYTRFVLPGRNAVTAKIRHTIGSRFQTIRDDACFRPFHSSAVISHISAGNRPAT
jgi:hypothetical protein